MKNKREKTDIEKTWPCNDKIVPKTRHRSSKEEVSPVGFGGSKDQLLILISEFQLSVGSFDRAAHYLINKDCFFSISFHIPEFHHAPNFSFSASVSMVFLPDIPSQNFPN